MILLHRLLLIISVFTMSACANVSSQEVTTKGIYADIEIINNSNNSISIETDLTVGNGLFATYVDLDGGDRLDSTYLGALKTMKKAWSIFGDISYKSSYSSNQPYATDNIVTVNLYRTLQKSAPNSYVLLPDPISSISISSPIVTTGQTITVSWPTISGRSYSMEAKVVLSGCTNAQGSSTTITSYRYFSDGGRFSFKPNDFLNPEYTCTAGSSGNVLISRIRTGSVDPAFGGGRIRAIYKRGIGFSIQ